MFSIFMSAQKEMFPSNTWDSTLKLWIQYLQGNTTIYHRSNPTAKNNLANKSLIAIKCIGHVKIKQKDKMLWPKMYHLKEMPSYWLSCSAAWGRGGVKNVNSKNFPMGKANKNLFFLFFFFTFWTRHWYDILVI